MPAKRLIAMAAALAALAGGARADPPRVAVTHHVGHFKD